MEQYNVDCTLISGRRVVFNLKVDIGKQSLFYVKKKKKKPRKKKDNNTTLKCS